jgi:hypothetical protein
MGCKIANLYPLLWNRIQTTSTSIVPQNDVDIAEMRNLSYLSADRSLMYLSVTIISDIAYSVGVLAYFNSNPGPLH